VAGAWPRRHALKQACPAPCAPEHRVYCTLSLRAGEGRTEFCLPLLAKAPYTEELAFVPAQKSPNDVLDQLLGSVGHDGCIDRLALLRNERRVSAPVDLAPAARGHHEADLSVTVIYSLVPERGLIVLPGRGSSLSGRRSQHDSPTRHVTSVNRLICIVPPGPIAR